MRILMAGAAALALAAGGAYAQGNGNGKGNGGGNPAVEKAQKGGKEDRGAQRGKQADRAASGRSQGNDRGAQDRGPEKRQDRSERSQGNDWKGDSRHSDSRDGRREVRVDFDSRDDRRILRADRDRSWLIQDRERGLIDGCPPGLAKKRNGCNPPGQVKDDYRRSIFGYDYRPSLFGLFNYDRRGDYYYRDGYLVRYGDGGIAGWIPLLGGALGIGEIWPTSYASRRLPDYYVDYYDLGGYDRYRYADNVIYRVDPEDAAIMSVAALITGDEFTVGQPMPNGYDVYNVPYSYRDRYYDTPDYMYRYSDGYIYQVDPETRLVAAAIELLI